LPSNFEYASSVSSDFLKRNAASTQALKYYPRKRSTTFILVANANCQMKVLKDQSHFKEYKLISQSRQRSSVTQRRRYACIAVLSLHENMRDELIFGIQEMNQLLVP